MQHAETHNSPDWEVKFVGAAITLYKGIWDAWNSHIHVNTKKESIIAQKKRFENRSFAFTNTHQDSLSVINRLEKFPYQIAYKKH
jgi:hypothetical protein